MAEITKMPPNLPSTDALRSIPDDLLGPIPAEIRLGANVLMIMEKPPEVKDVITVVMRLRVKDEGKSEGGEDNEELVHWRRVKIVTAWIQGQPEPPNPDEDQPGLFDADETGDDEGDAPDEIDINDGVDRPGFSDADQ